MDGYRQSLLGRALADVLQSLEAEGIDGDEVFALFDDAAREELSAGLHAASSRRRRAQGGDQEGKDPGSVFTHKTMELSARLRSFNRFEDKWSLQAEVPSGGLLLDGVPVHWATTTNGVGESRGHRDGSEQQELPMLVKLQELETAARK